MTLRNPDALGTKHRNAFTLLTAANTKTIKGEKAGYFSAILYLAPHTLGGGVTLCPHSTEDCRTMCLAGAGMSGLPLQLQAKLNRTRLFNEDRPAFLATLARDIGKLKRIAAAEGLKPVLRLNGTSDIMWERVFPDWGQLGLQRMDYTKIPLEHRQPDFDPGYHLTYSYMGPQDAERAVRYLGAGYSVAAVVPEDVKGALLKRSDHRWNLVDGDEHDLRFLDSPGSLVLLKPKGRVHTELMRPNVIAELTAPDYDARLERRRRLGHQ